MKILMISSYLPYPLYSGGHIRLYNLIKNLKDEHEITLICEKRKNQNKQDIEEVEKICKKVIAVDRKKQWSLENILKTGFSMEPFLFKGHENKEMKLIIQDELVREKYDLIHVETSYVYQNLPKVSIPVVLVEHNIEYLVYKRFAKHANPILKPFLYTDILKLKKKEEEIWKKVTKLVAVSDVEKRLMKRQDVSVVSNGVDTEIFKFRNFEAIAEEKRILFIGDFKWIQNKDTLDFILTDVWPKVLNKLDDMGKNINPKLWIVGKNIPESFKKMGNPQNVIFDEKNTEETPIIFNKSYILLSPLRVAGGTSYKILEAMSSGTAVVTTSLGIERLEAKNQTQALASETAEGLSENVCELLLDKSL
ncbi:MAG TPA: glycosyltransferase family 4 protein, partial [Candidatus Sulfotelmatobacter sp.]|nr:glycosyltransferase family 4 protein [Candidatus Sulfotelmatobacter sp.]